MSSQHHPGVPPAALWLGGAGLIPFVCGALGLWLFEGPRWDATLSLFLGYSAVILSFMGAIHWGLAMSGGAGSAGRAMGVSVIPALLAWLALAMPARAAMVVFALGFVGVYVVDILAVRRGQAPTWYPRLRAPLTVTVMVCLVAAGVALVHRGGG